VCDLHYDGRILTYLRLSCCLIILLTISAVADHEIINTEIIYYGMDVPNVRPATEMPIIGEINESYMAISISELDNRIIPGEPMIPFKTAKILIPQGAEVKNIEVIPGEQKYLGRFSIVPGQNAIPICRDSELELELSPLNETIYESVEPYPKEFYSIIGIQKKCGYDILYVNLYPIRYIPKTGDVYYIQNFGVNVTTDTLRKLDNDLFRGILQDRDVVSQMVDNPDVAATYTKDFELIGGSILLDGEYDYVIITSQALKEVPAPNFLTLAEWKNSRGVRTTVVTLEDIYEAYKYTPHEDNQEMIRNFIRDVYLKNKVIYILLGGDGDVARIGGETWPDNNVPSRSLCCCWKYKEDAPAIVSDLYYACLDGNFDANGNRIYGEVEDKPDLLAEVYVGRAPVDSAEELNNFVRKTISYESVDPADPYINRVLMVGEYIGWPFEGEATAWGGNHKDATKDRFPRTFKIMKLYDRDYVGDNCGLDYHNWPKSELMNRINRNEIHLINHVGTTNFCDAVSTVMKMNYADADSLKNDKYFFGYSVGSWAGSFDNKNPEGIYLPYDCVLEHFVTAPCGAFAFIGLSCYGWAEHKNIDSGPSNRFDNAFWSAIFKKGILNIGRANQDSKEENIGWIYERGDYGKSTRRCYYGINLLGDPQTPLMLPTTTFDESPIEKGADSRNRFINLSHDSFSINSFTETFFGPSR